ncbi:MAG: DegT/DnrJ/EryC1/StrS family aminotransferase, partial [Candidatus Lindowbacteria bacterium]|nr:DegT/DnrJ/EryC1/StrS family aminotransferase [Candidatus Lindowbacteria bacterium]
RVQLRRLDSELAPKRVAFALQYRKALSEVNGIQLFKADIGNTVPHIQPIRVLNGRRDHVRQALIDNDIQAGIHYKPNHLLTLYRRSEEKLPVAEQLYEELLTLPLHPALSSDDVDTVVKTLIQSL